jgi:hypothetical protein
MSTEPIGDLEHRNSYTHKLEELLISLKNLDNFYQDYDWKKIIELIDNESIKTFSYMSEPEAYDILNGLLYIKINNVNELKRFLLDSLNQYNIRQDELIAEFIDIYYHYDQNDVNGTVTLRDIYDKYHYWHRENIGFVEKSRIKCRQDIVNFMEKANYKLNEKKYFIGLSLKQINDT